MTGDVVTTLKQWWTEVLLLYHLHGWATCFDGACWQSIAGKKTILLVKCHLNLSRFDNITALIQITATLVWINRLIAYSLYTVHFPSSDKMKDTCICLSNASQQKQNVDNISKFKPVLENVNILKAFWFLQEYIRHLYVLLVLHKYTLSLYHCRLCSLVCVMY